MTENDSTLFEVNVENFNGPLDVLLDLAKAQKVNLENISITILADQFHISETKVEELVLRGATSMDALKLPQNYCNGRGAAVSSS